MRKPLVITAIIACLLFAGYFAFNKNGNKKEAESLNPHRGTLTGEYVCLPPLGMSGPETPDCHYAIKTDENKFYIVDFNLMSQDRPDLKVGDHFTASGVITSIENLNTDYWRKYPTKIEGIFSITDSVKKI